MADADGDLAGRVSSLALSSSDIVIVVGLENAAQYNFRAGRVLNTQTTDRGRVGVQLLHGECKRLSVQRSNLLRASKAEDREALLTRIVLERQSELRACRSFLYDQLHGEEGLLLHIASFFPRRETMALTTGFAMGRIVPSWVCATVRHGVHLGWNPIHDGGRGWDGANVPVDGEQLVRDGIVRIDCAVVDIGSGQFLVAGGCADHPSKPNVQFFASAFLYDSLTHVATALPNMPHVRHGCSGAHLDGKVYIVGGDYVALGHSQRALCCVFDLSTRTWTNLPGTEWSHLRQLHPLLSSQHVGFCPAGAIEGRVVLYHAGRIFAFNPQQAEMGWVCCYRSGGYDVHAILGENACEGVEWGRHFVVSAGRGGSPACDVMAFSFLHPPSAPAIAESQPAGTAILEPMPTWALGRWAKLGATGPTGRVGCGLAVVHDRLYVSGGVNERGPNGGRFDGSVAYWDGSYDLLPRAFQTVAEVDPTIREDCVDLSRPWVKVEGLELPVAMHAHCAITIPWLPWSVQKTGTGA